MQFDLKPQKYKINQGNLLELRVLDPHSQMSESNGTTVPSKNSDM